MQTPSQHPIPQFILDLLDLLTSAQVVQAFLVHVFALASVFLVVNGSDIPDTISNVLFGIVGYYFASQVTPRQSRDGSPPPTGPTVPTQPPTLPTVPTAQHTPRPEDAPAPFGITSSAQHDTASPAASGNSHSQAVPPSGDGSHE